MPTAIKRCQQGGHWCFHHEITELTARWFFWHSMPAAQRARLRTAKRRYSLSETDAITWQLTNRRYREKAGQAGLTRWWSVHTALVGRRNGGYRGSFSALAMSLLLPYSGTEAFIIGVKPALPLQMVCL